MKNLISTILLCLIAFSALAVGQETKPKETTKSGEKPEAKKANQRPAEPEHKPEPFDDVDVKTMATKCVNLETEKGNIKLEMFPESAPNTVRNFLNLVAVKALDNTTFSRVVPDFVIQGGDLYTNENITTEMKWRAVRSLVDEPNPIKHEVGVISMARGDEPNSATTSFFILLTDYNALDGKFAAFGRVNDGLDVVKAINKMPVKNEKPDKPIRIVKASIENCAVAEESQ